MLQPIATAPGTATPAAEEALVEDRVATWDWFLNLLMTAAGVVGVIVILMAIFLVG